MVGYWIVGLTLKHDLCCARVVSKISNVRVQYTRWRKAIFLITWTCTAFPMAACPRNSDQNDNFQRTFLMGSMVVS